LGRVGSRWAERITVRTTTWQSPVLPSQCVCAGHGSGRWPAPAWCGIQACAPFVHPCAAPARASAWRGQTRAPLPTARVAARPGLAAVAARTHPPESPGGSVVRQAPAGDLRASAAGQQCTPRQRSRRRGGSPSRGWLPSSSVRRAPQRAGSAVVAKRLRESWLPKSNPVLSGVAQPGIAVPDRSRRSAAIRRGAERKRKRRKS
jgi:hypothetical protein